MTILMNYYYLLYKLHTCNILWIIEISDNYKELKNKIRFTEDSHGSYLIVERIGNKNILTKKFKQFQKFLKKSSDSTLFYT
tara:strand:+ start:63 stop:305 length:243 start_codon:yes stop_codon:yes gene_type:complete